jgi:hypothetical protein
MITVDLLHMELQLWDFMSVTVLEIFLEDYMKFDNVDHGLESTLG